MTKLELSQGRWEGRVHAGSVKIDPERTFLWIHYRRDDGVEGFLCVGEPGPYDGHPWEEGLPSFDVATREWTVGKRLEKRAHERNPRLVD